MNKKVVVTGAGGFIGHHFVSYLRKTTDDHIVGVDIKLPEFESTKAHEFLVYDLRDPKSAISTIYGDEVYAFAADMGGMGFISSHHAQILHNNAMINLNTLEAARKNGVKRYLFSSSACVYPNYKQTEANVVPLKESDAYPADPQDAYGWEKLITEHLCHHYHEDYGIETRIVRFHNIFGPQGTWCGGREKAPAAISRKIAEAKIRNCHEIEVWGDGEQTRSFCYINDCVEGIYRLMQSDYREPLNLGQDRLISINALVDMVSEIANWPVVVKHVEGPQGVRGRNSDNTLMRSVLAWDTKYTLEEGMKITYAWIEREVRRTWKQNL